MNPPLVLAPMSGVTCSAFRRLIKRLNRGSIGMVVTEFLSVEGMTRDSRRTLEMMKFLEEERPVSVQIFGKDPARMSEAALMIQDAGADVVDVNCGCPAPKVVKKGGGCELMRQPLLLAQILREIKRRVKIPLTMKMRAGWDNSSLNALEIALMAEQEGVEALTVHGRTRTQMYRGDADWEIVERIAQSVSIPVCGSGDVCDAPSAAARLAGSVAGIYIGRAALSNPFVFREAAGEEPWNVRNRPLLAVNVLKEYIELLREDFPENAVLGRVKNLACRMAPRRWWWKTDLLRAGSLCDVMGVFERVAQEKQDAEDACGPAVAANGFKL